MKTCSKCGMEKEDSEFEKGRRQCRKCRIELSKPRSKQYYENNKEKIIYNVKKYEKNNHEVVLKRKNDYYVKNLYKFKRYKFENKEVIKEKAKKYRESNKENQKIRMKIWRKNNKEVINNYKKIYNKKAKENNPIEYLKTRYRSMISEIFRKNGYTKKSHTSEILGCTFEELMNYLGPKPGEDFQLDHICPCAQGKTEEELTKLQHFTNFQWLTADQNEDKLDHWTPKGEELCKSLLGREWVHKKDNE